MADIDFQPSKIEQQNIGKTTETPVSNAQNEVNESRASSPTKGLTETANQTEAMTKGPNPILPPFDMSDFEPGAGTKNATKSTDTNLAKGNTQATAAPHSPNP